MSRNPPLAFVAALAILSACNRMGGAEELEAVFRNPPESTKPWTYWYWIDDNISKEGITHDLEAMAKVGIGEAFIGNVTDTRLNFVSPGEQDRKMVNRGQVPVLSDAWWECVEHAVREAERLGIKVGMFNCPGWSQSGGPWVKPEQAMRYLVSTELRVSGPCKLRKRLGAPAEYFQQVAVQAFPVPASDSDRLCGHTPHVRCAELSDANLLFDGDPNTAVRFKRYPLTFEIELDEPYTARSLIIRPAFRQIGPDDPYTFSSASLYGPMRMSAKVRVEVKTADGEWREVASRDIDRANLWPHIGPMVFGPICESFPAVTAREFRIVFPEGRDGVIGEIELSGAARLSHYVEKQLGKMSSSTQIAYDTYSWEPSAEVDDRSLTVDPTCVVDLTERTDSMGLLTWDVPPGEWIVLRTGMVPTGTKNKPTLKEGRGYEVDKMNRDAARAHFDAFAGELLRRMPPEQREGLRHVIADSYEQGSLNWTEGFAEEFVTVYGYDPYPWLPVLTGRIVESTDRSDRFLWDMRRLIADKIASGYVRGLREKCEENGLTLWLENYGHWGFPGEFLNYGGASHQVGGEFWLTDRNQRSYTVECRAASSAAHIYGKNLVSAEAFTASFTFRQMPRDLKLLGDWAWTEGINHYVLHLYIHQPDERKPGMNAWFGTDFNRHSTWFHSTKSYFEYIRRSCALLQSGRNLADVAYFIGEDAPKMTGPMIPALPAGYQYDFVNAEVLKDARVVNGRIVLASGADYANLVLPPQKTMRPEMLEILSRLAGQGASLLGYAPETSPSNRDYPGCDDRVSQISAAMWNGMDGISVTERRYGKGHIFCGIGIQEALSRLGVGPDLIIPAIPQEILFTHRAGDGFELYFLSNQSEDAVSGTFGFDVANRQPELWNAETGEIRDLPLFEQRAGRTYVPLEFGPADSWFIVFRKRAVVSNSGSDTNFPTFRNLQELNGNWNVAFRPVYDTAREMTFRELDDWTQNDDPYIRYFSGTATYKMSFEYRAGAEKNVWLDLGTVHALADVTLNGQSFRTLWRPPYRGDISEALKEGYNTIEVTVTNCWLNRLIGDLQFGARKYTWVPYVDWNAETPLLPSGLIGPVTLLTRE